MAKNIIVFSDGTGQRGGVTFDESRTNIYKLFRATRCGPDSSIDPALHLTYYDPDLGTIPEGRAAAGFADTELRCFAGTGDFKWEVGRICASSSLKR